MASGFLYTYTPEAYTLIHMYTLKCMGVKQSSAAKHLHQRMTSAHLGLPWAWCPETSIDGSCKHLQRALAFVNLTL